MVFADYNAFRVAVATLIEGEDYNSSTFNTNTLDLLVGLGEARVYQGDGQTPGLRASTMLSNLSVVVASNAAALPADLLELKEVYFSGKTPMEILPLDRIRALESDGSTLGQDTRYAAQDGDNLRFWPQASGTVLGRYYATPAPLKTVTWALATTFARYPELFIYATLFDSAVFLGMESKIPMWEGRYRQLADGANRSEAMRVYGGGPLKIRVR